MNDMKKTLEYLGFKHVTGTLWVREGLGMVVIPDPITVDGIINAIYNRGYAVCQAELRAILGIKENN